MYHNSHPARPHFPVHTKDSEVNVRRRSLYNGTSTSAEKHLREFTVPAASENAGERNFLRDSFVPVAASDRLVSEREPGHQGNPFQGGNRLVCSTPNKLNRLGPSDSNTGG